MKPSKSFIEWINNMKEKSPLWYVVKDDAAVKKAEKDADMEAESNDEKLDDFRKFQQAATTRTNN